MTSQLLHLKLKKKSIYTNGLYGHDYPKVDNMFNARFLIPK